MDGTTAKSNAAYEQNYPNEVTFAEENDEPKIKGITIVEEEDQFKFQGATGFNEEEKSVFQKAGYLKLQESIPIVPRRVAIACLVFNFLFPGLGTLLAAFTSILCPCDQHMASRWTEVFVWNIVAGICQFITTVYFFIGYFWGIWWGIQMVQKAPLPTEEKKFNITLGRIKKQSYLERT